MKKVYLLIFVLITAGQYAFSQNTYPFPSSGSVGIGTTTPAELFDVFGQSVIGSATERLSLNSSSLGFNRRVSTGAIYDSRYFAYQINHTPNATSGSDFLTFQLYAPNGSLVNYPLTINSNGGVGINTTTPSSNLDVNGSVTFGVNGGRVSIDQGGFGINRNVDNGVIYNSGQFAYQFGKLNNSTNGASDILGLSVWYPNQSYGDVTTNALSINGQGKVGVFSDGPISMFQVDDGVSKTSIGSAGDLGSSALNYGTGYIGFNAARYYSGSGSTQSWAMNADANNNNGGGVIYGSVAGGIYFAPIASTSAASQTLGDADIATRVMMKITPTAVYAKQIYVQTSVFPDYVFKRNYHLRSLADVKSYIDQYHHLPEIPSAATVEKDGLNLGEMNKILTKKVEELTLYLIATEKRVNDEQSVEKKQQQQIDIQRAQLELMNAKLNLQEEHLNKLEMIIAAKKL